MDVRQVIAQTNRFTSAVRKLLSIKGEEHAVNYGVHLEDERPEYSFLKSETLFVQYNEVTSAAGNLPVIGVRNELNSGVLGVINAIWCNLEAAGVEVRLNVGITAFAPLVSGGPMHPRDLRRGNLVTAGALAGALNQMAGVAAAAGGSYIASLFTSLAANDTIDVMAPGGRVQPIILPPGWSAWLSIPAVGVHTLKATFVGYERPLESGELIG